MEITKREIIASVVIVSFMLIVGFFISGKLTDWQNDRNAEYQKAIHIEDIELFQYGMRTNVGNAFVYGDLEAVDTVTFEDIGGEYLRVKKVEEHYNQHTRRVPHTRTVNGETKTYYTTEVYYSWDYYDKSEKHSERIRFCGVEFDYEKIQTPSDEFLKTQKESSTVRFKYYGVAIQHTGTIYTRLEDGTISEESRFFKDCNPEQAETKCITQDWSMVFWFSWLALTAVLVGYFCYAENRWLEV